MNEVDVQIMCEHMKELRRDAENVRLVRSLENQENDNMLTNVRKSLGRGLILLGQQLLR